MDHFENERDFKTMGFLQGQPEKTPVDRAKIIAGLDMPNRPPTPAGRVVETRRPAKPAPYVLEIDLPCDGCGGSGFDPGGIDPWGPEPCPVCHGTGTQKVTKNYLAEALRIAGNPECTVPLERAHLVAIVQYCRQVVDAAMCRPKATAPKREPVFFKASRHSRRAARTRKVIQFKRRKRNVDIRPQRT
jgi:hypothetical protein